MDSSAARSSTIAKLNQLARETSLARIETICQRKSFSIPSHAEFRSVKDHWMGQVLISGPQLRIIFCVFFNAQSLKKWSVNVFERKWEEISLLEVHDLSKEFCNLVAGYLKSSLHQNQMKTGVSLPFLSRGFDRIFSAFTAGSAIYNDFWKISADGIDISCSTSIEIFKDFQFEICTVDDDNGTVEFL